MIAPMRCTPILCLLLAPSVVLAASEHEAVDDGRLKPGQTVKDRAHPEYQAGGVNAGGFVFSPSIKLTETYDNNVFFQDTNEVDDFVTNITPVLAVRSNWNRHGLAVEAGSDIKRHASNKAEDAENYWLKGSGQLDISEASKMDASLEVRQDKEGRGSPNAVNGIEPTGRDTVNGRVGFEHRPGQLFVRGHASTIDLSFDNVTTSLNTTINNADRSRRESEGSLTLGYEISRDYDAFIRYTAQRRAYDQGLDDLGFARSSDGSHWELGADLNFSGLVTGQVAVGRFSYDYDDARFSNTSDWSTSANVFWQLSPLTTMTFSAARTVAETTIGNASGYINLSGEVGVYHELLRNLNLQLTVSKSKQTYQGFARTDNNTGLNISAVYKMDRNISMGASWDVVVRDSDNAGFDYNHSAASVWVKYAR